MKKYIIDAYPQKAQFIKDEPIEIVVEIYNPEDDTIILDMEAKLSFLAEVIEVYKFKIRALARERKLFIINIAAKSVEFKGYGVDLYMFSENDILQVFSTSFDVVSSWRKATRYGFLSDFYDDDIGDEEDIVNMKKYHINIVQFYDWMYKGEQLVPPTSMYNDMMGRKLSIKAVKEKIKKCHRHGMRAVAYGAVYSASYEFYIKHKEWALYNNNNQVISFIDRFYIMNISEKCPWHRYIIEQYKKAIEQMDFDGIHMDTYGFPKKAISKVNNITKVERLEEHFPTLINNTRNELEKVKEDVCLIFNNVGNWPVDTVACAHQDTIYIEVWKPYERYFHIQQLISWAKYMGKGKPVILAAYLKPFIELKNENRRAAENALLILTAAISANGAYHLALGENNGVLTQGYYVDYSTLNDSFIRTMRNYYDFIVRFSNVLFDSQLRDVSMTHADGDNKEYLFENCSYSTYGEAGKVWMVIREKPDTKSINIINLSGCENDLWNKGKEEVVSIKNITIRIQVDRDIQSIFLSSPDYDMGRPYIVDYNIENKKRGKYVVIKVPEIYIWSLVVVRFKQ